MWIKIGVYASYVLLGVFALACICFYKSIKISIAVLKTASNVITRNVRVVFVPAFCAISIIFWCSIWITHFTLLMSTGKIKQPVKGSQLKEVELSKDQKYMVYFQIFMFFWVFEFLQALFNYALIVGTCIWYFSSQSDTSGDFSLSTGFHWGLRYNMGSLALGSFILAVIWIIRITFEYVDNKLKASQSEIAKTISNLIRYMLDCFHRFVKFLNDNAYI